MKPIFSSETSDDFQPATMRYIRQYRKLDISCWYFRSIVICISVYVLFVQIRKARYMAVGKQTVRKPSTLKMEATCSSETSVLTRPTAPHPRKRHYSWAWLSTADVNYDNIPSAPSMVSSCVITSPFVTSNKLTPWWWALLEVPPVVQLLGSNSDDSV
jgi:hypothetical protein